MPVDIAKWQTHPYSYTVVRIHRLTLCQTPWQTSHSHHLHYKTSKNRSEKRIQKSLLNYTWTINKCIQHLQTYNNLRVLEVINITFQVQKL